MIIETYKRFSDWIVSDHIWIWIWATSLGAMLFNSILPHYPEKLAIGIALWSISLGSLGLDRTFKLRNRIAELERKIEGMNK